MRVGRIGSTVTRKRVGLHSPVRVRRLQVPRSGQPNDHVERQTTEALMQLEFALARARQQFFPASWNGHSDREMVMSMSLFLRAAVRSKLRKIGPKVIHLLLVLNAGEDHFCAWNHPLWVLDVFFESSLIPNNSRILICV